MGAAGAGAAQSSSRERKESASDAVKYPSLPVKSLNYFTARMGNMSSLFKEIETKRKKRKAAQLLRPAPAAAGEPTGSGPALGTSSGPSSSTEAPAAKRVTKERNVARALFTDADWQPLLRSPGEAPEARAAEVRIMASPVVPTAAVRRTLPSQQQQQAAVTMTPIPDTPARNLRSNSASKRLPAKRLEL